MTGAVSFQLGKPKEIHNILEANQYIISISSISSVYPVYHQYIDILLWLRIKNDENASLIRSNSGHFLETGYVLSAQFCLLIGGPIIIPIDIMGSSSSPF